MPTPFSVRDQDNPGRDLGEWDKDGNITIPGDFVVGGQINRAAWDAVDVTAAPYNADPTGMIDSTEACRAAAASGARKIIVPPGTYLTPLADNTALFSFANRNGIEIDAPEAEFVNPTSYTSDNFTSVFLFDNCDNIVVNFGQYTGFTLPTPLVHHGYRGATVARFVNGCNGIDVKGSVTNARYGVHSGEYADPTKGYCKNFKIDLITSFCGYPIALYLAEGVRYEVDADAVHRGVYLAGCFDVKGTLRWADQYIADIVTLITDAMTGTGTSRACRKIDVVSIDKGSTIFQPSSACAGIATSRVEAMTHEDIDIHVECTSTDSISSTVGGFKIASGSKDLTVPPAPFNWESFIVIRNLKVSGVLDHSAQTTEGNTAGDIFVRAWDTTTAHAGTLENICFEDLIIKQSSGNTRGLYLEAPGIIDGGVKFENFQAPNATLNLQTNATVPTVFDNSTLSVVNMYSVAFGSLIAIGPGTTIGSITGSTTDNANTLLYGGTVGGGGGSIRHKQATLTLAGATTTWTGAIPTGAMVLGVQGRVQTLITGATGYQVGPAAEATRYVNTNTVTAGATWGPTNAAATEITPRVYQATTDLIVTAKTSDFTGGTLRVAITYLLLPAMTS